MNIAFLESIELTGIGGNSGNSGFEFGGELSMLEISILIECNFKIGLKNTFVGQEEPK